VQTSGELIMSGHSKWSTIKRKKGANDAKRGAIFTRLAKELAIAARDGGGDPDVNFTLRLAIERARAENMPKDNIERAIKRGTGEDKDAANLEQLMYEGYAPHGIALIINTITDNRNRTVAELRHILNKYSGSLGEGGSVAWQFTRSAYFSFPSEGHDEEDILDLAIEAGADDIYYDSEVVEIYGTMDSFKEISDALNTANIKPEESELRYIPNQEIELPPDQTLQVMKVIELVEDLDDVQSVSSNLAITDEALTMLEAA
jgi:YebC/PmpR family DNA-binding regulatory protein